MNILESVFVIVNKMGAAEKRYFKLYSSRHIQKGATFYNSLFDILNDLNVDEVYVQKNRSSEKRIFREQVIIDRINLAKDKEHFKNHTRYLYKHIVRSLEFFYADKDGKFKLRHLLNEIDILLSKNLTEVARGKIKKAKVLAKKDHDSFAYLELLTLERKLIRRYERKNVDLLLDTIQEESNESLDALKQYINTLNLYDTLHINILHGNTPSVKLRETLDEVEEILSKHQFSDITPSFEFHNLVAIATLGFNFYYHRKEFEKTLYYLNQGIQLFERNKRLIKVDPDKYITFHYNYAIIAMALGRFNEIEDLLLKMKKTNSFSTSEDFSLKLRLFQQTYRIELLYNYYTRNFEKSIALVPVITKGMKEFRNDLPPMLRATFCHNISLAFFRTKDYETALDWVNQILIIESVNNLRSKVQVFTRLLQIMLHFELNNYGVVAEYLVPSFLQLIKKFKRDNILTSILSSCKKFVRGVRKSCYAIKEKRKMIFEDLAKELTPDLENTEFLELLEWLQQKAK